MWALAVYFRRHAWQRRLLTASVTVLVAGLAAVVALPHIQDYLLLRDLGSTDARVRNKAIARAIQRGRDNERTLRRLNDALDEADDVKFAAIVSALKWLGQFNTPDRNPLHVDRAVAMELRANPSAETREIFLRETILSGRDNRYVRQVLASAAGDRAANVRAAAPLLAAALGEDGTVAKLLDDSDPNVVAAAALDAGLAGRPAHAAKLAELLEAPHALDVRAAAAYALARTDHAGSAARLRAALAAADEAGQTALRDRLLHVMAVLGGPRGEGGVLDVLERARKADKLPPAAALTAAARLRLAAAAPHLRRTLVAATTPNSGTLIRQVVAATRTADAMGIPARREIHDVCETLWSPRPQHRLMLLAAARALGRQAELPQPGRSDTPSRAQCIRTLRIAAIYDFLPTTAPAGKKVKPLTSPFPSAAAAVALWKLRTPACEEFVRNSAGEQTTLPGDYVGWHVGIERTDRAFDLALTLLPPPDADPSLRVYNDDMRAAGAVMLAIAARTDDQKRIARDRVRSRLEGRRLGGEDSFHVRGAYQCALAILGDPAAAAVVKGLLETGQFSQRRAITALTLAGRLDGLDWLLWNRQLDEDDLMLLLVEEQIGEVIATCLPELPTVDAAASADLARWQLTILRHTYAIRRSRLRIRPPPPATRPATQPATRPATSSAPAAP